MESTDEKRRTGKVAMTALNTARFAALLFTALMLGPAFAHLLELPNKIGLPVEAYFTVQQNYRGWELLGVVVLSAFLSVSTLAVLVRHGRWAYRFALFALLCLLAAHALFWVFTFPANQATANWTSPPADWQALRVQWEYSHAVAAVLDLLAFVAVALAVLADCRAPSRERQRAITSSTD